MVNRHGHLGGILSSGLGVWDTRWEGKRSPIYDEVRAAIFNHYRQEYGAESPQYRDALPGKAGHTNGRFEPRVVEQILEALVAKEKNIRVVRRLCTGQGASRGARLLGIKFRQIDGTATLEATARVFADCTYEGDLLALAKARYRVGREGREEFHEPHAGIVFMRATLQPPSDEAARLAAAHSKLKLRPFPGFQQVLPASTGQPDDAVQACNYRTILTTDPANRLPIPEPTKQDPYFLKSLEVYSGVESVPNDKFSWNRPQLIGLQTEYVEADWPKRRQIMDEHWETTLALLYFLQHDHSVPEKVREGWLKYGLAKDEFTDHGHRPYEIYVREARRLVGRMIFTEHDARLAAGFDRAPIHADSVAMTEWYLDAHGCTTARVPGSLEEGKMMLHQETFPGQIPYRALLPQNIDNLLVPVCLSATHVAWGTVRLEPVWMQTGEAAGFAAALSLERDTSPAQLSPDVLLRALAEHRSMISFFNDIDVASKDPWIVAAQYFGTKGFFHDYDARPEAPLKTSTARLWVDGWNRLCAGKLDPGALPVPSPNRNAATLPP